MPTGTGSATRARRPSPARPHDCDDTDAAVHPGAGETCGNGIDDDCNDLIDSEEVVCFDTVVIIRADWSRKGSKLTVQATSTGAPDAVLTLVGYGNMTYKKKDGIYVFSSSQIALPQSVTVSSSAGGSASAAVATR
jgi:hypothetical protein